MHGHDAVRARARPTVFFVSAAVHAALAVPLWVVTYGGLRETGLSAAWHGHEMIFGYAYAVFGGFFLTRVPRSFLILLLALWGAARIGALLPEMPANGAFILSVAYPCLMFGYAVWPFVRAVKRWRNAVFAPLLAAMFAAALLEGFGRFQLVPMEQGGRLAFDLIVAMLFAMGGRFTAGAVSGAQQRLGRRLHRPAQPGLERIGLVSLVAVAAIDLFAPESWMAAVFSAVAAAVILARLWHWRCWRVVSQTEVLFLLLGYGWLAIGLGARVLSIANDAIAPVEVDHIVAVGALGTLSMTVMSRVARQRCGFSVQFKPVVSLALCFVSFAALLRFLAALDFARNGLLIAAATCWSAAFIILAIDLFGLWRGARRPG